MNKEQLQKLAGLLKEAEDFDLSDNPVADNIIFFELETQASIVFSNKFRVDVKDFAEYINNEWEGELDLDDDDDISGKLISYLEDRDEMDVTQWTNDGYSDYGNDDPQYDLVSDFNERDYKKLKKYLKKK